MRRGYHFVITVAQSLMDWNSLGFVSQTIILLWIAGKVVLNVVGN